MVMFAVWFAVCHALHKVPCSAVCSARCRAGAVLLWGHVLCTVPCAVPVFVPCRVPCVHEQILRFEVEFAVRLPSSFGLTSLVSRLANNRAERQGKHSGGRGAVNVPLVATVCKIRNPLDLIKLVVPFFATPNCRLLASWQHGCWPLLPEGVLLRNRRAKSPTAGLWHRK